MLQFTSIEAFYMVVKKKSFSIAARELFVSQATISVRIKCLEDEVGMKLLLRSKSKVELTYAGEVFLKYAEKLLAMERESRGVISQLKKGAKGTLTILASSVVSNWALPYISKKISKTYTDITAIFQTGFTSDIIPRVANGEVNFGIIRTNAPYFEDARFNYKVLGRDRIYFIANQNHKIFLKKNITLEDISKASLIAYGSDPNHQPLIDKIFGEKKLTPKDITHLNDISAIKVLTSLGGHIACISELTVTNELKNGNFLKVPVDDYDPVYRYSILLYKREQEMTEIMLNFLDIINSLEMIDMK